MIRFLLQLNLLLKAYGSLLYANPGDNVTLPCYYGSSNTANYLSWYRQVAGESPQTIFTFYKAVTTLLHFRNNFDAKRFSLYAGDGFYHLNISNVQHSDMAMYYCGKTTVQLTELNEGTFLALRDQSGMSFLQQSDSLSVERGASATLKCTVLPGNVDAKHRVYWFKKDPEEPRMGILYVHSHGGRCVQSAGSAAQSCVYSLSKSDVKRSDSGMYYCAVASCGEIVFGKGTRLDVRGSRQDISPVHIYVTIAALLMSLILNVMLSGVLCQKMRRKHHKSKGSQRQQSAPEYTTEIQDEEQNAVQYVALDFKKGRGTRRSQRNTEEETIYSGVKPSDTD